MLDTPSVLFGMFYVSALWVVVIYANKLKRFANRTSCQKVKKE